VVWDAVDRYPALDNDTIDLISNYTDGGGRLLFVSHDAAWAFGDPTSGFYNPKNGAFLKFKLKSNWITDPQSFDKAIGLAGDPISGPFTAGVQYTPLRQGGAGDEITSNPAGGTTSYVWKNEQNLNIAIKWVSAANNGTSGQGSWGGKPTRLVFYTFELFRINAGKHNDTERNSILNDTIVWLAGGYHPKVKIVEPWPGIGYNTTVNVKWLASAFGGRHIAKQSIYYSPDGGQTMKFLTKVEPGTTSYVWNTTNVKQGTAYCLMMVVTDDADPPLTGSDEVCTFAIGSIGGDKWGPIVVPGSVSVLPNPAMEGSSFLVQAIIDDTYYGSSKIEAAEFHIDEPNPIPGNGVPMWAHDGSFDTQVEGVEYYGPHNTMPGPHNLTIFGRDWADNWGPPSNITFHTNPKGAGLGLISGNVTNDNKSIQGATLVAYDPSTGDVKGRAGSDSSGKYVIPLPAGIYTVNASATGFYSMEQVNVIVTSGNNTQGIDFVLKWMPGQEPGGICGVIRDAVTKDPINVAYVTVYESGTSNQKGAVKTTIGSFKFDNLKPGLYDVNVSAVGYYSNQKNGIPVTSGTNLAMGFDLTPILMTGSISGKVMDNETGQPIAGAIIIGYESGTQNQAFTWITSAIGTYLIPKIPGGVYDMNASATGYYDGGRPNIIVEPGKETKNVDIYLKGIPSPNKGDIKGTIRDSFSKAGLSGVTVKVNQAGYTKYAMSSNVVGEYYFSNVTTGKYDLNFEKSGYKSLNWSGTTVLNGQTTTIDVEMEQELLYRGTIMGKVTDKATNAPISGATVTLSQGGISKATNNTDVSGIYKFTMLAPGMYDIRITKDGYNDITITGVNVSNNSPVTLDLGMEQVTNGPGGNLSLYVVAAAIGIVLLFCIIVFLLQRKRPEPVDEDQELDEKAKVIVEDIKKREESIKIFKRPLKKKEPVLDENT
jgi:hypothetical protein